MRHVMQIYDLRGGAGFAHFSTLVFHCLFIMYMYIYVYVYVYMYTQYSDSVNFQVMTITQRDQH